MDPAWGNWITVPRHLIHLKRPGHSSAAMSQTVSDSALRQPHGLSGLRAVLARQRIRLTDGQRRHTKPTLKPTSEPAWLAKSGLRHQEHSLSAAISDLKSDIQLIASQMWSRPHNFMLMQSGKYNASMTLSYHISLIFIVKWRILTIEAADTTLEYREYLGDR